MIFYACICFAMIFGQVWVMWHVVINGNVGPEKPWHKRPSVGSHGSHASTQEVASASHWASTFWSSQQSHWFLTDFTAIGRCVDLTFMTFHNDQMQMTSDDIRWLMKIEMLWIVLVIFWHMGEPEERSVRLIQGRSCWLRIAICQQWKTWQSHKQD